MEEPDIVFTTRKEARDYAGVLRTVGEYSYDCRVRKIDRIPTHIIIMGRNDPDDEENSIPEEPLPLRPKTWSMIRVLIGPSVSPFASAVWMKRSALPLVFGV